MFASATWLTTDPATTKVFVWVLGNIRHTPDTSVPSGDRTPPGSVDTTLDDLAIACAVSRSTAQRAVKRLEDLGTITRTRRAAGVRIHVPNWRRWRAGPTQGQMGLMDLSDRSDLTHPSYKQKDEEDPRSESVDASPVTSRDQDVADTVIELVSIQPRGGKTDYALTVEYFHLAFLGAYKSKPTWGAREGMLLKRLIKAHGSQEVRRRIDVLFSAPPSWLKPPFTLGTLSANFDALVKPSARGARNVTAEDLFAQAMDLAKDGR